MLLTPKDLLYDLGLPENYSGPVNDVCNVCGSWGYHINLPIKVPQLWKVKNGRCGRCRRSGYTIAVEVL